MRKVVIVLSLNFPTHLKCVATRRNILWNVSVLKQDDFRNNTWGAMGSLVKYNYKFSSDSDSEKVWKSVDIWQSNL